MQTRPKSLLLPSTKLLSPLLRCASLIPVLQQSTSSLTRSGVVAAASRQLWHTSEKACTGQAGAAQHIQVDQAMKKTSIGFQTLLVGGACRENKANPDCAANSSCSPEGGGTGGRLPVAHPQSAPAALAAARRWAGADPPAAGGGQPAREHAGGGEWRRRRQLHSLERRSLRQLLRASLRASLCSRRREAARQARQLWPRTIPACWALAATVGALSVAYITADTRGCALRTVLQAAAFLQHCCTALGQCAGDNALMQL